AEATARCSTGRSCARATGSCGGGTGTCRSTGRRSTSRRTTGGPSGSTTTEAAEAAKATTTTDATKAQATDVTAAYGGIPGGLHGTGFVVDCDAVMHAVVDQHVGVRTKTQRAVPVLVGSSGIGNAAT